MKIKKEVIEKIRENTRLRRNILRDLDVSETTLWRMIKDNKENGDLTKLTVLNNISTELEMSFDEIISNN